MDSCLCGAGSRRCDASRHGGGIKATEYGDADRAADLLDHVDGR